MGSSNPNLQDGFLSQARRENLMVAVSLTSGTKLEGKVKGFDTFTLVLNNNGRECLIYKHAISSIIPLKAGDIVNQNKVDSPKKEELKALAEKYNKKIGE